jgi:hypothetical protein
MLLVVLAGCSHHKKPSLSGDEPVEVKDFIDFFPVVKAGYQINDHELLKKNNDSLLISYRVFTQFVPDSLVTSVVGKNVKAKFYPLAKVEVPKQESYLFVKAVSGEKSYALLVCFDKKNKYLAGMPVLVPDQNPATQQISGIDRKFSIFKIIQRKNADGTLSEGKEVFVLNSEAKNFTLILTDQLEDKPTEIINPIDTLPRKNKFSADYGIGKMNLVSIRDDKKSDRFNFFIHFEKNNGECSGELKGEAKIVGPGKAEFRSGTSPCVLEFIFTSHDVTLKEMEGCGLHRGPHCVFDGSFPKKKPVKPAGKK